MDRPKQSDEASLDKKVMTLAAVISPTEMKGREEESADVCTVYWLLDEEGPAHSGLNH